MKTTAAMDKLIGEALLMRGRGHAAVHQGRWGIVGNAGTLKGLVSRGLAEIIGDWHVLTDAGEARRVSLLPVTEIVPITTTTEDSLSLLAAVREAGFHGGDDEAAQAAQTAAVAFYAVATSDDVDVAWHEGPSYQAAREALRQACEQAYPDIAFTSIIDGITDNWIGSLSESIECWQAATAHWADVAAADQLIAEGAEIDQRAQTWDLPGDAERACQADEDAATYAEILAEQDTDDGLSGQDMQDLSELRREFGGEVSVCCEHAEVRCAEHVSVDAWLADLARQDAADVMPGGEAVPWKSRNGKHGRHSRKR